MVSTIELVDTIVRRASGRRRRYWTTDQKRRIVDEARGGGVSVSAVARRYDLNTNLLFTWLRDPRLGAERGSAAFLPVEIQAAPATAPEAAAPAEPRSPIAIETPCGLRVHCDETVDEAALSRVLLAIRRAS